MPRKFLAVALWLIGSILFTAQASAQIQTYEGVGEYWLERGDTLDYAKKKATALAERDALEQVYIYVSSDSTLRNSDLSKDEIITIAAGLIYVTGKKFSVSKADGNFVVRATVNAEIDIAAVVEAVEREKQSRLQH